MCGCDKVFGKCRERIDILHVYGVRDDLIGKSNNFYGIVSLEVFSF